MSEIVEAENISDVSNTRNAIRKIQLKILKILDKCPVETRMLFDDGGESSITITFLERAHERERKPTGGGRGSRDRRRRRRQQQRLEQQQSQQHEQQQQPLQQTEPEQFSAIITEEPELAEYNLRPVEQNSSPTFRARIPHSGLDQGLLLHQPRVYNIPTGGLDQRLL